MRILALGQKLLKGSFCYLSLRDLTISQHHAFQQFRASATNSVSVSAFLLPCLHIPLFYNVLSLVKNLYLSFPETITLKNFMSLQKSPEKMGHIGNGPITQHQAFCHRTSFNSHLPSYLLSLFLSRTNSVFLLVQIDSIRIPNVRKTLYSTSNIYHPKGNIVNYIFFTSLHLFCFLCG